MQEHVDQDTSVATKPRDTSNDCIDWDNNPGQERQCDDEDPCAYHDTRPQFHSAAIYFEDRYYGGPEEGGWWYDAGEPVLRDTELAIRTRFFATAKEAYEYASRVLQPICDKRNKGRRPTSSMASEGAYAPHVTRGLPAPFPEHRPHYE